MDQGRAPWVCQMLPHRSVKKLGKKKLETYHAAITRRGDLHPTAAPIFDVMNIDYYRFSAYYSFEEKTEERLTAEHAMRWPVEPAAAGTSGLPAMRVSLPPTTAPFRTLSSRRIASSALWVADGPVPMELGVMPMQPQWPRRTPLTGEERELLRSQNGCFYCRQPTPGTTAMSVRSAGTSLEMGGTAGARLRP